MKYKKIILFIIILLFINNSILFYNFISFMKNKYILNQSLLKINPIYIKKSITYDSLSDNITISNMIFEEDVYVVGCHNITFINVTVKDGYGFVVQNQKTSPFRESTVNIKNCSFWNLSIIGDGSYVNFTNYENKPSYIRHILACAGNVSVNLYNTVIKIMNNTRFSINGTVIYVETNLTFKMINSTIIPIGPIDNFNAEFNFSINSWLIMENSHLNNILDSDNITIFYKENVTNLGIFRVILKNSSVDYPLKIYDEYRINSTDSIIKSINILDNTTIGIIIANYTEFKDKSTIKGISILNFTNIIFGNFTLMDNTTFYCLNANLSELLINKNATLMINNSNIDRLKVNSNENIILYYEKGTIQEFITYSNKNITILNAIIRGIQTVDECPFNISIVENFLNFTDNNQINLTKVQFIPITAENNIILSKNSNLTIYNSSVKGIFINSNSLNRLNLTNSLCWYLITRENNLIFLKNSTIYKECYINTDNISIENCIFSDFVEVRFPSINSAVSINDSVFSDYLKILKGTIYLQNCRFTDFGLLWLDEAIEGIEFGKSIISNSNLRGIKLKGKTFLNLTNSNAIDVRLYESSNLFVFNSSISYLSCTDNSSMTLLNSTINSHEFDSYFSINISNCIINSMAPSIDEWIVNISTTPNFIFFNYTNKPGINFTQGGLKYTIWRAVTPIYESFVNDNNFIIYVTNYLNTKYIDNSLPVDNVKYWYKITAEDNNGNRANSSIISIIFQNGSSFENLDADVFYDSVLTTYDNINVNITILKDDIDGDGSRDIEDVYINCTFIFNNGTANKNLINKCNKITNFTYYYYFPKDYNIVRIEFQVIINQTDKFNSFGDYNYYSPLYTINEPSFLMQLTEIPVYNTTYDRNMITLFVMDGFKYIKNVTIKISENLIDSNNNLIIVNRIVNMTKNTTYNYYHHVFNPNFTINSFTFNLTVYDIGNHDITNFVLSRTKYFIQSPMFLTEVIYDDTITTLEDDESYTLCVNIKTSQKLIKNVTIYYLTADGWKSDLMQWDPNVKSYKYNFNELYKLGIDYLEFYIIGYDVANKSYNILRSESQPISIRIIPSFPSVGLDNLTIISIVIISGIIGGIIGFAFFSFKTGESKNLQKSLAKYLVQLEKKDKKDNKNIKTLYKQQISGLVKIYYISIAGFIGILIAGFIFYFVFNDILYSTVLFLGNMLLSLFIYIIWLYADVKLNILNEKINIFRMFVGFWPVFALLSTGLLALTIGSTVPWFNYYIVNQSGQEPTNLYIIEIPSLHFKMMTLVITSLLFFTMTCYLSIRKYINYIKAYRERNANAAIILLAKENYINVLNSRINFKVLIFLILLGIALIPFSYEGFFNILPIGLIALAPCTIIFCIFYLVGYFINKLKKETTDFLYEPTIKCPNCGFVNLISSRYCGKCNSFLSYEQKYIENTIICDKCKTINPKENLYCKNCGNKLKN